MPASFKLFHRLTIHPTVQTWARSRKIIAIQARNPSEAKRSEAKESKLQLLALRSGIFIAAARLTTLCPI